MNLQPLPSLETTVLRRGDALVDAAYALLQTAFGEGFVEESEFASYLDGHSGGVVVGVLSDDRLSAVGLGRVLTDDEVAEYEALVAQAGAAASFSSHCVGLVKSVAVDPDHRRSGHGITIGRQLRAHLLNSGCTALLSFNWQSGEYTTTRWLQAIGLHPLVSIRGFWREDSLRRGYLCPSCGNPCDCTACIYWGIQ